MRDLDRGGVVQASGSVLGALKTPLQPASISRLLGLSWTKDTGTQPITPASQHTVQPTLLDQVRLQLQSSSDGELRHAEAG